MNPRRALAVLLDLEPLRSRIVALTGLFVGGCSLALAVWVSLPGPGPRADPPYVALVLALAMSAFTGSALARLGQPAWGARMVAAGLALVSAVSVLLFGLPNETALASFVGVLLLTAVTARPLEVLVTAAVLVVLGVMTTLHATPLRFRPQALVAVSGLLISGGALLTWALATLQRRIQGLADSEAHYARLSHIDALTGLGNRRRFDESLARLLAHPGPAPSALVVLDVDNLKGINDRFGHPAGDEVLRAVARAILDSVRDQDIACRIGGDEFAVLLGTGGVRGAEQIAARIRERLREDAAVAASGIHCSVSLGLASAEGDNVLPAALLAAADAHLYASRGHSAAPASGG